MKATQVAKQLENDRVNKLVYDTIPQMQNSITEIATNQKNMSDKIDGVDNKVSDLASTLTKVQIKNHIDISPRSVDTEVEDVGNTY